MSSVEATNYHSGWVTEHRHSPHSDAVMQKQAGAVQCPLCHWKFVCLSPSSRDGSLRVCLQSVLTHTLTATVIKCWVLDIARETQGDLSANRERNLGSI